MKRLYDSSPYELLPKVLQTSESEAVGYAVGLGLKKFLDCVKSISLYADLEHVPEKILDIMALEMRTQYYDEQASREVKEALVRNTLAWYMHGGTNSILQEYLTTLYGGGETEEWYTYGGEPYYFKAIVHITEDQEIAPGEGQKITKRICVYKNVRSWLETLTFQIHNQYMVSVEEMLGIAVRTEFYPRQNLAYLKLNGIWKLDGNRYLNGYDVDKKLDFYPMAGKAWMDVNVRIAAFEKAKVPYDVKVEQSIYGQMKIQMEIMIFREEGEDILLLMDGSAWMNGSMDMSGYRQKKFQTLPAMSTHLNLETKSQVKTMSAVTEAHNIAYMDRTWKLGGDRKLDAHFIYHTL